MSNYSTLKQAIQSVIKTNGNEEITGTVLQNALISIVDSIGANYTFAGVATPQTDAGAPDQNVFYIGGPGTYTNFGSSYTVPLGSVGIFTYNGSWTTKHLYINVQALAEGMVGTDMLFRNGAASHFIDDTYNATILISGPLRTCDCLCVPKTGWQINVIYSDDMETRAATGSWTTGALLIDKTYKYVRILIAKSDWGNVTPSDSDSLKITNLFDETDLIETTFPQSLSFYQGSVSAFGSDITVVNNIIVSDIFLTDKVNGCLVAVNAGYSVAALYSDDKMTRAGSAPTWEPYKVINSQYKYCRLLISKIGFTALTPSDNFGIMIKSVAEVVADGIFPTMVFEQGSSATFNGAVNGISTIIMANPTTDIHLFGKYLVIPEGYMAHVSYSNDMSSFALKSGWQVGTYKIDENYAYYRISMAKSNWANITPADAALLGVRSLPYNRLYEYEKTEYVVKKNGTGVDYTSLAECIENNYGKKNVVIRLQAGVYDIISELEAIHNEAWWNNIDGNIGSRGIELGNNITIIGTPNAVIQGNYTGNKSNVKSGFSVFNAGEGGFSLIGVKIVASNIRYCVHDERGGQEGAYTNTYKGCDFYLDNSANDAWASKQCIGGGLGVNGNIYIEDCKFETVTDDVYYPVSYHNSSSAAACSRIVCRGNYFADNQSFRFSWYGTSTLMTDIFASNNNLGAAILTRRENADYDVENIRLYEWNNIIRGA